MDFKKLPESMEAIDLWQTLHDARLNAVTSDMTERTLTLQVDIPQLQEVLDDANDTSFFLKYNGVDAVRVQSHPNFEHDLVRTLEISHEELHRRAQEEWMNGRWNSMDWIIFEDSFGSGYFTDIMYATLFQHNDKGIIMLIGADNDRLEIVIDAASLTITSLNGIAYTLQEFTDLGNAFWDGIKQRSNSRRSAT